MIDIKAGGESQAYFSFMSCMVQGTVSSDMLLDICASKQMLEDMIRSFGGQAVSDYCLVKGPVVGPSGGCKGTVKEGSLHEESLSGHSQSNSRGAGGLSPGQSRPETPQKLEHLASLDTKSPSPNETAKWQHLYEVVGQLRAHHAHAGLEASRTPIYKQ